MRSAARSAYVAVARLLRFDERLLRRIERDDAVVVLNLHRVSPERNDFYPPIPPDAFDELVSFLAPRFEVTTFSRLAARTERTRPAAVLSFDDGFYDFVEHAMPVLARHGVQANQNIIVSTVLTGEPPWTQRLMDLLHAAPQALLAELRLPGFDRPPPGPGPDERARYGAAIGSFLTRHPRAARAPLLAEIERSAARLDVAPTRMMGLDDVRRVSATHEVGAHSFAHDLMEVETLEHFREDLERCDAFFREHLGRPVDVYAFPFGGHRPEQVTHLLERGVSAVLVGGDRYARTTGPVYPRFNVAARGSYALRLEALGARARPFPF